MVTTTRYVIRVGAKFVGPHRFRRQLVDFPQAELFIKKSGAKKVAAKIRADAIHKVTLVLEEDNAWTS